MNKNQNKKKAGGYNNYSLRSATLVEGYVPGPMRQNILMDPSLALGAFTPNSLTAVPYYNGPGTLNQALPDAARFQSKYIFAEPSTNPFRQFGEDSRQIETYLVEQLTNNPLSQYTSNPGGEIPGFNCNSNPSDYSRIVNKRNKEYKNYFENGNYLIDPNSQNVVNWVCSDQRGSNLQSMDVITNKNADKDANVNIVYNLSTGTTDNPMIARPRPEPREKITDVNKCYSGSYKHTINNTYDSGQCMPDRAYSFTNPLMINHLK